MSTEDNKALVRRAIEEVWNQGKVALIDGLDHANLIHHDPDFPTIRTREDYKQWVIETRNAFPDLHLTIEDLIADQDRVVTCWTFRGTNTGALVTPMPLPATGRQVTVPGITISHAAGGKFLENWHQADSMGFLHQLGLIPAPGQAS